MKLSGVIFDLNGTIVIDGYLWDDAYGKVFKSLGQAYDKGKNHICGVSIDDNWKMLIDKFNIKTDKTPHELSSLTNKEYLKRIDEVKLNSGFEDLVTNFRDTGIPIGLASSSHWDMVDETFEATGIGRYFDFVTTGEEVVNSKPSPDIFDLAGEKNGAEPEEILVFEDSESGVEAAKAAGMKVIGVYRDAEHKKKLSKADALVADFEEVTPEMIEKL